MPSMNLCFFQDFFWLTFPAEILDKVNDWIQTFPWLLKSNHTVDGQNPAPVDMVNNPLFIGFYTSQVVQDFFHQQY